MNIEAYADVLNLDLVVRRYHNQGNRYTAQFEYCEIKDDESSRILSGTYGNAKTYADAVQDYCNKIRGRVLVVNAGDPERRRQYRIPMELKA